MIYFKIYLTLFALIRLKTLQIANKIAEIDAKIKTKKLISSIRFKPITIGSKKPS